MPNGFRNMNLMSKYFKETGTKTQIVGVFYGESAHLTLNDKAYNEARNVTTGNPYKGLIADLISQGIHIEECAVAMKNHHWVNDDLLPGVKVNSGALVRLVQLVQQGYVQIQP